MIVLDERFQAGQVAALWKAQYGHQFGEVMRFNGRTGAETYEKLLALDGKGTAAEYARIIGNDGWVAETKCDECGIKSWVAVRLGEEPDYESRTARICLGCLRKAVALAESASRAGMPSDQGGSMSEITREQVAAVVAEAGANRVIAAIGRAPEVVDVPQPIVKRSTLNGVVMRWTPSGELCAVTGFDGEAEVYVPIALMEAMVDAIRATRDWDAIKAHHARWDAQLDAPTLSPEMRERISRAIPWLRSAGSRVLPQRPIDYTTYRTLPGYDDWKTMRITCAQWATQLEQLLGEGA